MHYDFFTATLTPVLLATAIFLLSYGFWTIFSQSSRPTPKWYGRPLCGVMLLVSAIITLWYALDVYPNKLFYAMDVDMNTKQITLLFPWPGSKYTLNADAINAVSIEIREKQPPRILVKPRATNYFYKLRLTLGTGNSFTTSAEDYSEIKAAAEAVSSVSSKAVSYTASVPSAIEQLTTSLNVCLNILIAIFLLVSLRGIKLRSMGRNTEELSQERLFFKEQIKYAKRSGKKMADMEEIENEMEEFRKRNPDFCKEEATAYKNCFLLQKLLSGTWKGCYCYLKIGTADRLSSKHEFTAKFQFQDGQLSGSIKDSSQLGAAAIMGSAQNSSIQFEKRYAQGEDKLPISYLGNIIDDGVHICGTWHLANPAKPLDGVWVMTKDNPWWKFGALRL
jgi:hypothetical protein